MIVGGCGVVGGGFMCGGIGNIGGENISGRNNCGGNKRGRKMMGVEKIYWRNVGVRRRKTGTKNGIKDDGNMRSDIICNEKKDSELGFMGGRKGYGRRRNGRMEWMGVEV